MIVISFSLAFIFLADLLLIIDSMVRISYPYRPHKLISYVNRFSYTDSVQFMTVPFGITSIRVYMWYYSRYDSHLCCLSLKFILSDSTYIITTIVGAAGATKEQALM